MPYLSDAEFEKFLLENRENLKEMLTFWTFVTNLNKVLKWIVYIGAPIAVMLWSIRNFIKRH
jgi:hypothetical protein